MADRKTFHDSVVPIPVEAGLTPAGLMVSNAARPGEEVMPLHFSLSLPENLQAELEQKVEQQRGRCPRSA